MKINDRTNTPFGPGVITAINLPNVTVTLDKGVKGYGKVVKFTANQLEGVQS